MQEAPSQICKDKVTKYVKSNAEQRVDSDQDDGLNSLTGAVFESSRVTEEDKEQLPSFVDNTT